MLSGLTRPKCAALIHGLTSAFDLASKWSGELSMARIRFTAAGRASEMVAKAAQSGKAQNDAMHAQTSSGSGDEEVSKAAMDFKDAHACVS